MLRFILAPFARKVQKKPPDRDVVWRFMCKRVILIQLYILIGIAHCCEVALKLRAVDDYRETVVVGVETERGLLPEALVQEEVYVVLLVVDKPKG